MLDYAIPITFMYTEASYKELHLIHDSSLHWAGVNCIEAVTTAIVPKIYEGSAVKREPSKLVAFFNLTLTQLLSGWRLCCRG